MSNRRKATGRPAARIYRRRDDETGPAFLRRVEQETGIQFDAEAWAQADKAYTIELAQIPRKTSNPGMN